MPTKAFQTTQPSCDYEQKDSDVLAHVDGFQRSSPTSSVKSESQAGHDAQVLKKLAPSLPSFASFQRQTGRSEDGDVDGPEIAPMAARLPCNHCATLGPMIRDVATAVAELDENVQSHCNKVGTRPLDMPYDDSVRTAYWILERLRCAKADMIDASHRYRQPNYYFPHPRLPHALSSRATSPGVSLKRSAVYDKDDYSDAKRPRSGGSAREQSMFDRRPSIDFLGRSIYSPPDTESASTTGYARQRSPDLPRGAARAFPSPSSMVYPQPTTTSLPAPTVNPVSPASSYQAGVSNQPMTTDSATSAHIADLQHQVTLKSLALQSLQTEYSGLLQKLQREQVKSQSIEKKTTVSELEVNDLTGRNEELAEQVSALQTQLDDFERKRDGERADAGREKEQWSAMLDMSNRLQAKLTGERQSLASERDALQRHVQRLEQQISVKQGEHQGAVTADDPSRAGGGAETSAIAAENLRDQQRQVCSLKERVGVLTTALLQVQGHARELSDHARCMELRNGDVMKVTQVALENARRSSSVGSVAPTLVYNDNNNTAAPRLSQLSTPRLENKATSLPTPTSATGSSTATMTGTRKAKSPGARELSVPAPPSTSHRNDLSTSRTAPATCPANPSNFRFIPNNDQQPPPPKRTQSHIQPLPPHQQQSHSHISPYTELAEPQKAEQYSSSSSSFSSSDWTQRKISPPSAQGQRSYHPQLRDPPHAQDQPRWREPNAPSTLHLENGSGEPSHPNNSLSARRNSLRGFPDMTTAAVSPMQGPAGFRQWEWDKRQVEMGPPPRPLGVAESKGVGY
ncbi:hypothetical protein LTR62_005447 [Meristemomyces frigidus]|uniref:Uncharacterized protein n=1 Tax=Meristemomyces frigidus TaxID=1508187 RepID=A0AAN7TCU2_9PEZI|nr:hypothetical protein LTR62_005447 [Meristemomyces frigidus]